MEVHCLNEEAGRKKQVSTDEVKIHMSGRSFVCEIIIDWKERLGQQLIIRRKIKLAEVIISLRGSIPSLWNISVIMCGLHSKHN